MTLSELIKKAVANYGDNTFIIDRELYRRKVYSYDEIFKQAKSLCIFFKEKGITHGNKIIIYLPNSSNYASLLWACALSGVIAVPIDFNMSKEFVRIIYKKVQAKL